MREVDFSYGGLVTERVLRRMSRYGYLVFAVWTVILVTWGLLDPDPYARGWWLVLENLFAGRGVCLYEGVRLGFGRVYLIVQCGGQDLGMTLVTVPWIIRFHHRVSQGRVFDRILRGLDEAAERNQKRLRGWGVAGLFLFAFMPTAGPMLGTVAGYLLGMRMRVVLPAVLAGHITSLLVFLSFFDWLEPVLRASNEGLATYFAWIGLALVLTAGAVARAVKHHRNPRRDPELEVLPAPPAAGETGAEANN